jgi:hypothetical protein
MTGPLCGSVAELLGHADWFADPGRRDAAPVPSILVVDDFYADPEAMRAQALDRQFVQYIPPDPEIVGAEIAAANAHRRGRWLASAFVIYHGKLAERPFHGSRHNPESLRRRLEALVGEPIDEASWQSGGDHWNGAFHLVESGLELGKAVIHHHYKPHDVEGRGWSGVIYLSPDAPPSAGTSFWRDRRSGRCVAAYGTPYSFDKEDFEMAYVAENRFNRLVLFRENVWHRVEHGFGSGDQARLTQTLFFQVAAGAPAPVR